MKWNETKWNEMKWNEGKWNEMKWREMKGNEGKWKQNNEWVFKIKNIIKLIISSILPHDAFTMFLSLTRKSVLKGKRLRCGYGYDKQHGINSFKNYLPP